MLFYYIKVPTCSCLTDIYFPLMRSLKWGTAWSFISRGIGNASSQTFDHPSLLNKVGLFWNFWLWPAVILMPFEIEFCAVSHFKGLINFKNISSKQERSNTFTRAFQKWRFLPNSKFEVRLHKFQNYITKKSHKNFFKIFFRCLALPQFT